MIADDPSGNPVGLTSSGVAIVGGIVITAAGNVVAAYGPA